MSNPDPNNPVAYAYDPIGSRVLTTGDTETEEHFADALNQHTLISNPVNHVNPVLFFPDLDASGQLAAQFTYEFYFCVGHSTFCVQRSARKVMTRLSMVSRSAGLDSAMRMVSATSVWSASRLCPSLVSSARSC